MRLTEKDIRYMVSEALKRLNEENEDLDSIINDMPINQISDAFDLAFNRDENGFRIGNKVCDFYKGEPYATYNVASPELQQKFIACLTGRYTPPPPPDELAELDF